MTSHASETIVVDGYNLLRRGFRFLEVEHGLRAAREKLEVRLREYLRAIGPSVRILLVYDGAGDVETERGGPPVAPELEVLFTRPPRSADEEIVDLCHRLATRGPLTVVTSDSNDIGSRIGGLPLRWLTSEEFVDELDAALLRPANASGFENKPRKPSAAKPEKPDPDTVAPAEVEEWLRVFSQPKPALPRKPGRRRHGGKS